MREWRASWNRLNANAFEAILALAAVLEAVNFFIHPHSRLGAAATIVIVRPWDYVWSVGYGAAGLLILAGILTFRRDIEVLGLGFFAAGVAIQGIAVWDLLGIKEWQTLVFYVLFVGAIMQRMRILVSAEPAK